MKSIVFLLPVFFVMFVSCQKEAADANGGTPAVQNPKVGTIWTFNYSTYYTTGGLQATKELKYRAKSEETLGGEKWLHIVDLATDTTVYYLNIKTGGLFQFANGASNLFCKNPATLNETYTSFNAGATENFTVKGVNDIIATGIGDVPANYYEGVKSGDLIDLIWYNTNAWIVWRTIYRRLPPPGLTYYRYSTMHISGIVY